MLLYALATARVGGSGLDALMKTGLFLSAILLLPPLGIRAQGNLQYDQQSATAPAPPSITFDIQGNEPVGQSFVPSLSSVGFVQFDLFDGHPGNGLGATLYVNLRSNSITGPLMSSTSPVYMPETPSGGGVTNFFFSTPAVVTPGNAYFFEVIVQSGDVWRVNDIGPSYQNGRAYISGVAQQFDSLYFREGIIVPEPSAAWIVIVGVFSWFYARRRAVKLRVDGERVCGALRAMDRLTPPAP